MEQAKHEFREITNRATEGVINSRRVDVNPESLECLVLKKEPSKIYGDVFPEFLMSCVKSGASDITIQSDQQPRVEIHGVLYKATRNPWSPPDVLYTLMEIYDTSGPALINSRKTIDFSYELNLVNGGKQRFRVNATGIHARDGKGIEITFRVLPSEIPDLAMIEGILPDPELFVPLDQETGDDRKKESGIISALKKNEQEHVSGEDESGEGKTVSSHFREIVDAMRPRNGLVIVAGGTGSGKSTTLAAVIRAHLEDRKHPVKIVDIQEPIEYVFHDVAGGSGSSSIIGQSEVGTHIESFSEGVRSALRRKPGIICVGEARDLKTISVTLEAALTGHLVYTTTHANDIPDTIRRLLSAFPAEEREARALDLISSTRFCMVQHLISRIDKPGVVPVREYLKFTQRVKEKLVGRPNNEWPSILADEVAGRVEDTGSEDMCQQLSNVARPLYQQGMIGYFDAWSLGAFANVAKTERPG